MWPHMNVVGMFVVPLYNERQTEHSKGLSVNRGKVTLIVSLLHTTVAGLYDVEALPLRFLLCSLPI